MMIKTAQTEGAMKKKVSRLDAILETNKAIVATGKCPDCSAPLVRNTSLSGWYQCARYGEPGFRGCFDGTGKSHPEYDALPACSFQCFIA